MPFDADFLASPGSPPLSIIVAMTRDRLIGCGNKLPWHIPEELQLFKKLTRNNTVIMGHRTYTSIGHPLSERHNIVLSSDMKTLPGVQLCRTLKKGIIAAVKLKRPVFIIGGEELYRQSLPLVSSMHISWIKGEFAGDRYFPFFQANDWLVQRKEEYPDFQYVHYQRKREDLTLGGYSQGNS